MMQLLNVDFVIIPVERFFSYQFPLITISPIYEFFIKSQQPLFYYTNKPEIQESTKNPLKTRDFTPFFEILGILLEIPSISNSRCEKPSISKFLIQNT